MRDGCHRTFYAVLAPYCHKDRTDRHEKDSNARNATASSEYPQPRLRHAYDYEGEYEFPVVQHWTASAADPDD